MGFQKTKKYFHLKRLKWGNRGEGKRVGMRNILRNLYHLG